MSYNLLEYPWVEELVGPADCSHVSERGLPCKKRTGKFYHYRFTDWTRDVLCDKHVRDTLQAEREAAITRTRVFTQDARLGEFRLMELAARTIGKIHNGEV